MNPKTKKIIAREGLILALCCGSVIVGLPLLLNLSTNPITDYISVALIILGLGGYPIYLLIRFIIWVVKTLKK